MSAGTFPGVFCRGTRKKSLHIKFKGPDGKWVRQRTEFVPGEEALAAKARGALMDRISAGTNIIGDRKSALTMAEYADLKWFAIRKDQLEEPERDEGRMRLHVLPALGAMPLEDVRARHVADLFNGLRKSKALAPKSIRNVYGVLCALFRDAEIEGLVDKTPCILTRYQLGKNVDSDSFIRHEAIYTREELVAFISDERIPMDRRVVYALEGVGAMRHDEAARLVWENIEASIQPLGRLNILKTKIGIPRYMPIHPVLAALLAEWKLSGWAQMMERPPKPDDLVVPTPKPTNKGPRVPWGSERTDGYSWKRMVKDLATLGLRHRRGHDFRRTMISLARSDGAVKEILKRGTHKPPKEVIEGYTTFEWDVLCREVSKFNLTLPRRGQLIALPIAVGGGPRSEPRSPGAWSEPGPSAVEPVENKHETIVEAVGIESPTQSTGHIGTPSNTVASVNASGGLSQTVGSAGSAEIGSFGPTRTTVPSSILDARRAVLASLADPDEARARAEILARLLPHPEWKR